MALLAGMCYLYYDNRRLKKRAALESQLEQAALLQQQQLQQLAAPALVVSEQQPDWGPASQHQEDGLKEADETVVVDSVEPLVDSVEEVLDKPPVELEGQDVQQDSGEGEEYRYIHVYG